LSNALATLLLFRFDGAGFSACYAVPFYDGQLLPGAVRRLNLGGKALTNLLKETVSYRSLNMADEGLLMERLKDQLCWVSRVSQLGGGCRILINDQSL
jgi:actin-related protein